MTAEHSNDLFKTSELLFACYLYAKGVLYLRTEWPTLRQSSGQAREQAFFVFKYPPEELLLAWQTAQDSVSARALYDAQNFFRDELRKR